MNDASPPTDRRDRLASIIAPRRDAIPQARRHSQRVARLRRWLLWGSGAIIAAVAVGVAFHSLRFLPADLRFSRIATEGTRITIESPKLVGYRKDGRPYELRARTGVQDIAKPDVFELERLEVRIQSDNESNVVLTAEKGLYDAKKDRANLSGGAHLYDGKHYDLRTDAAVIDFRGNIVTSDQPTRLTLDKSIVTARSVEFSQNERRATFSGAVHTTLPGDDDAETGAAQGSAP
ncbi:LPS export ABC transporter periplasmic protein LptC [Methylosinus sporium]|uniref:LPS export ABC transporter periplasmic protein LptC n=1 Tax=Methylosinus sporium TaxID=428 RepID=A0A549SXQ7_METSR|nr:MULTISPECIES: LPS export ABC transporter periplasmic protein LptC [Methylosinus]MBU3889363.1 LPS export ABC transporter periplasmic protein LptC [Methylosinus sp. KRF6]TRL34429.1 LPS export ABC transporter periplasmic protein LptC [Methylosinus sporium]